jgi:hypothetical protein
MRHLASRFTIRALATALVVGGAGFAGCSADEVLEVKDPDIIDPSSISDAAGAAALRIGALARFNRSTSGGESFFLWGGLLADEFRSSDTFSQRDETDQRRVLLSNGNVTTALRDAHGARVSALQAAEALLQFSADKRAEIGEMLFVQAYIETLLAETVCSGIPLSTPTVEGDPLTTAQTFQRAIVHADSAILFADGTSALALSVKRAAMVIKGRALLDLGQYATAAAAVKDVPDGFQYLNEQSQSTRDNGIWSLNNNNRRYTVVDREGGNGLDFISANDPRVPVAAVARAGGFDGNTDLYRQGVYNTRDASFPVASAIEARLIEAEALLQTDASAALAKLNAIRAGSIRIGSITISNLPPLTLQATKDAQVNQLFRERAFWMFASGHRLGDLRRMIRQYGRNADAVFPTGAFFKSGTYGTDVNIPVTQAEQNNSKFTQCLDRNA